MSALGRLSALAKTPAVQRALYYSGFGVPLYVAGMMVSAFALRASGVGA